jgi:uridine phosphorylase
MKLDTIPESELILNHDGSIFHLHLRPEALADTVILVGDPERVSLVAEHFDRIESQTANREFVSKTGTYKQHRITALSTGIGTDNIDIVLTELDALANVDFKTRTVKNSHRQLNILRLGTCGAIQPDIPLGTILMSDISIGFDGLLNFYARRNEVCRLDLEHAFVSHMQWNPQLPDPYFIPASEALIKLFSDKVMHGVTISAPGFYGPQGRVVRLQLADPLLIQKVESFRYKQLRITNFEMEGSAIAGLAALLGHQAATICCVIANRHLHHVDTDYKPAVKRMIKLALDTITN